MRDSNVNDIKSKGFKRKNRRQLLLQTVPLINKFTTHWPKTANLKAFSQGMTTVSIAWITPLLAPTSVRMTVE